MSKVRLTLFISMLSSALVVLTGCSEKAGNGASSSPTSPVSTSAVTETSTPPNDKPVQVVLAPDEVLLETLDSSDYPLLKDIFESAIGGKPSCPDTVQCDYVVSQWKSEMEGNPTRPSLDLNARKAYLSSLDGKPPHVQIQISKDAFSARYSQLKQLVAAKNLCFLAPWKLQFVDNQYHFSGGNDRHTEVRLNLLSTNNYSTQLFRGDDTYLILNGKFFAPVPTQLMTDEIYKKYAGYSERPEEKRTKLKVCGKLKGGYETYLESMATAPKAPLDPNVIYGPVAVNTIANLFELAKPIEIVEPPSMKRLDTIPPEWFR